MSSHTTVYSSTFNCLLPFLPYHLLLSILLSSSNANFFFSIIISFFQFFPFSSHTITYYFLSITFPFLGTTFLRGEKSFSIIFHFLPDSNFFSCLLIKLPISFCPIITLSSLFYFLSPFLISSSFPALLMSLPISFYSITYSFFCTISLYLSTQLLPRFYCTGFIFDFTFYLLGLTCHYVWL